MKKPSWDMRDKPLYAPLAGERGLSVPPGQPFHSNLSQSQACSRRITPSQGDLLKKTSTWNQIHKSCTPTIDQITGTPSVVQCLPRGGEERGLDLNWKGQCGAQTEQAIRGVPTGMLGWRR